MDFGGTCQLCLICVMMSRWPGYHKCVYLSFYRCEYSNSIENFIALSGDRKFLQGQAHIACGPVVERLTLKPPCRALYFKARNEPTMRAKLREYLPAWAIGEYAHVLPRSRSDRKSRRTSNNLHDGRYAWCKTCMSSSHRPWQISLGVPRLQPLATESGKDYCVPGVRPECLPSLFRI